MQVCLSDHGIEIFKCLSYVFLAVFSVCVVVIVSDSVNIDFSECLHDKPDHGIITIEEDF